MRHEENVDRQKPAPRDLILRCREIFASMDPGGLPEAEALLVCLSLAVKTLRQDELATLDHDLENCLSLANRANQFWERQNAIQARETGGYGPSAPVIKSSALSLHG